MKRVVILSGVSGAGKTTYINNYISEINKTHGENPNHYVASADHYFYKPEVLPNGEGIDRFAVPCTYQFDPAQLPQAHRRCFRDVIRSLILGPIQFEGDSSWLRSTHVIFVDNTNTTVEEIAPYYLAAEAYGYEPEIVTLWCDHDVAAERNTHGTPAEVVEKQFIRLARRTLPSYWRSTDIFMSRGGKP